LTGEHTGRDGRHNIVVQKLDHDWAQHILDELVLVRRSRLRGCVLGDLWVGVNLVKNMCQDHIKVHDDVLDGLWSLLREDGRGHGRLIAARAHASGHAWHHLAAAVAVKSTSLGQLQSVAAISQQDSSILVEGDALGDSEDE